VVTAALDLVLEFLDGLNLDLDLLSLFCLTNLRLLLDLLVVGLLEALDELLSFSAPCG